MEYKLHVLKPCGEKAEQHVQTEEKVVWKRCA